MPDPYVFPRWRIEAFNRMLDLCCDARDAYGRCELPAGHDGFHRRRRPGAGTHWWPRVASDEGER